MPFMRVQIYLSTIFANAIFCFCSGQLDAWWELIDRDQCSAPKHDQTSWKYPLCNPRFTSPVEGYDEHSRDEAFEFVDGVSRPGVMAVNDTCWADAANALEYENANASTSCLFTSPIEPNIWSWLTRDQLTYRIATFLVLEHLMILIFVAVTMCMKREHENKMVTKKREQHWQERHGIMASAMYPVGA